MLAVVLSTLAFALPVEFTHTGRLLDAAGAPLSGSNTLTFAIYDADIGGNKLWEESAPLSFDDGYYRHILGTSGSNAGLLRAQVVPLARCEAPEYRLEGIAALPDDAASLPT